MEEREIRPPAARGGPVRLDPSAARELATGPASCPWDGAKLHARNGNVARRFDALPRPSRERAPPATGSAPHPLRPASRRAAPADPPGERVRGPYGPGRGLHLTRRLCGRLGVVQVGRGGRRVRHRLRGSDRSRSRRAQGVLRRARPRARRAPRDLVRAGHRESRAPRASGRDVQESAARTGASAPRPSGPSEERPSCT